MSKIDAVELQRSTSACKEQNLRPRSLSELLAELSQKQQIFSEKMSRTPERVQAILQARAQEIRAADLNEDEGALLEILEFTLGKERYAFVLKWVSEVCRVSEITEIPGTPAFVKGIVNFRSRIYSVIDLGRLLNLPANPDEGIDVVGSQLLILTSRDMEFAIRIDRLEGVRSLPIKNLQPHLATLEGAKAKYFKGVTSDHLILLDAEKILTDKKIVVA